MSKTPSKPKQEPVIMSPEVAIYFKESLAELRLDVKELLKQSIEHDKEIDRLKWKSGVLSLIGGVLSHFGMKFTGL